jgi:hypothetical protein
VITASWRPTSAEARDAARAARLSRGWLSAHGAVLVALGLLVAAVVLAGWLRSPRAYVFLGVAVLFLGLVLTRQDHRWWNRHPPLRRPLAATLTADELRYTGDGLEHVWPLTAFRYAVETPELFVLLPIRAIGARRWGFEPYLPKRALPDPAAVRALLAARLEVR